MDGILREMKGIRESLLQDRAKCVADLRLTPADCLEELRKHALKRLEEGKEVVFYDPESGYMVDAHPCPSKQEWAWRVSGDRGEWYERIENVVERVKRATMFAADVED